MIIGQHRRNDAHAGNHGELIKIAEMNRGKRRFSGTQYERPAFLQCDIRGAKQQIVRVAGMNTCGCFHAAGHNEHAGCPVGTACRTGVDRFRFKNMIRQRIDFLQRQICFIRSRQLCAVRHDQRGLPGRILPDRFQHLDQKRGSGRAGSPYDESFSVHISPQNPAPSASDPHP